jgi:hypothetical protein
MLDLLSIAVIVVLFALGVALTRACESLERGDT